MANIFKKYTAGVYCMESDIKDFEHNDETTITTKYSKEVEVIVWKKLSTKVDKAYYSVVRLDGFNRTEWTKRKAERAEKAAIRQSSLSDNYYQKSREHADFLSLGEPIKIGHHSEKRHRKIIDQANNNMRKCCEANAKADQYNSKAQTLTDKADKEINIDNPECLELLIDKIERLTNIKEELKASKDYQSFLLTNLNANIRRYKQRLDIAKELWDLDFDNSTPTKAQIKAKKDAEKQAKVDN